MKKLLIAALLLLFITPISFFGQAPAFAATAAGAEPAPLAVEAASLAVNANGSYGFIQIPFDKYPEQSVWLKGMKEFFETQANANGQQIGFDYYTKVTCDLELVFHHGDTEREYVLLAPNVTVECMYWFWNSRGMFLRFPDEMMEFEIATDWVWEDLQNTKPEYFYVKLVASTVDFMVNEKMKESTDPGEYVGNYGTTAYSAKRFKSYTLSETAKTSNPIWSGSRVTNPPQSEDEIKGFQELCRKIDEAAGWHYGTTYGYAVLIGQILLGIIGAVSFLVLLGLFTKTLKLIKRSFGG